MFKSLRAWLAARDERKRQELAEELEASYDAAADQANEQRNFHGFTGLEPRSAGNGRLGDTRTAPRRQR